MTTSLATLDPQLGPQLGPQLQIDRSDSSYIAEPIMQKTLLSAFIRLNKSAYDKNRGHIGNSRDGYQFIFKKGFNSDRFQLFQCENCLDTSTELLEKDSYVIVLRGSQKPDDFLQDDLFLAQGEVHCLHFSSATIYSS